jgi:hypothetical protein
MRRDSLKRRQRQPEAPLGPGFTAAEYLRQGRKLTARTPHRRAREASQRQWTRTYYPGGGIEPELPDDPFKRWLQETEDACLQVGREWERLYRAERWPHRRLYHLVVTLILNTRGWIRKLLRSRGKSAT